MVNKPVLFWDFHGTLTLPDFNWLDAAVESAQEHVPEFPVDAHCLAKNLTGTCLPWFIVPDGDTRHLAGSKLWWESSEREFVQMYMRCGMSEEQAQNAAPGIRPRILQPQRYTLYDDALHTLEQLAQRGYKSYILSNNFPELPWLVDQMGIAHYFEEIFTSGSIGYDKPRREIFDIARSAISAQNSLVPFMIGDNPVDDIKGGKLAGFCTISVHNHPVENSDYNVDLLAEMLEFLT